MLIYKIIQSLKPTFILTTQVTLNIRELGKIWGLEPRFALSKHVTHIYQYHQIEILDTENIRKVWREPYVKFSKIFLLDTKNIMKFWWEPYLKFSEIFFLVIENIKKVWREFSSLMQRIQRKFEKNPTLSFQEFCYLKLVQNLSQA